MLGNTREGFEAYEQLAIHFEHRVREHHRAAAVARKALLELRNASRLGIIAPGAYRDKRTRFEQRLKRLQRKAGGNLLEVMETETSSQIGRGIA